MSAIDTEHLVESLVVERCAEEASRYAAAHARALGDYGAVDKDAGRGRQEGHINAGEAITLAIRALIPAKGDDHA